MNITRYMEEVRGNFSKCPVTEETSTFCTPTTLIPKKYMNINEKVFFAKSNGIILHRRLIYDFRDNGAWYFDPTTASDMDDKLYVKPIISPIIPEARVINLDTQKNIALPISAYPFICIGYCHFLIKNMEKVSSQKKYSIHYANTLTILHEYERMINGVIKSVTGVSKDGYLMDNDDYIMFDTFPTDINDSLKKFI